ncbi:MAG: alanine--tRNA ligase [Candidatus Micrarchaeota archaeon]
MTTSEELKAKFSAEWKKHYDINILKEQGFSRRMCKKCNRNFWAMSERDFCADPSCNSYEFIGNPPSNKKLGYIETWNAIKKYFLSHGHGYVAPYPTVARWRDDLYFTIASINDFQPYVVNGELEPPSNPLIVPQPCIRFGDIGNVGVTGRHYTNFVMIGQHAFNTDKTGLFYWKDEALAHDLGYLKCLGIKEEDVVFIEDVWVGGGNYGPSMEYFSRGLELGNCVFIQYETTKTGNRELKTKVIDMGAGLSRLAWITHGSPTSYEIVFGNVIKEMKKDFNVHIDEQLFAKYARIAGSLTIDEVKDINAEKIKVAKMLRTTQEELFDKLEPLHAIYATADHTCTALFTITDGMLPSNSGGGYNLRLILRRVFGFEELNKWQFDFEKIVNGHCKHLHEMFPHLHEGADSTIAVINEERKKFIATKEKSKGKVTNFIKSGTRIGFEELRMLYTSHGIPPEYVVEICMENKMNTDINASMNASMNANIKMPANIEIPGNFYELIRASDETAKKSGKSSEKGGNGEAIDVGMLQKTESLCYSQLNSFEASAIAILENRYVVLDKTAFYAESGGQVADKGTLNESQVKNVIKIAGVILHEIENPLSFKIGQKVFGRVDSARRKEISKNHTAAHLLGAAARKILGNHVWQAGSYKDENKAHLDITHYKRITQEELNAIEKKVNEWIMDDLPIVIEILPRNIAEEKYGFRLYQGGAIPGKELRISKIGEIDVQACGGTHHMNKTTGELGFFKIMKRDGIQDGVERITFSTGLKALSFVQNQEKTLRDAAVKLGVCEAELPKTAERFFEEWKTRGKKIDELCAMLVNTVIKELLIKELVHKHKNMRKHEKDKDNENEKGYIFKILDVDDETLIKIARKIAYQKIPEYENCAIAIINKNANIVCACGEKSKLKANEILSEFIKKYGGKGGGNAQLASGVLSSTLKN